MANLLDNSTVEFTPKKYSKYFVETLQKVHTIANGYVRVLPNITKDAYIKKLVMDANTVSQVDARDCAWSPVQRLAIDGKTMSVKNFKINEEQCLEELDNLYSEMSWSEGATKLHYPTENAGDEAGDFDLEDGIMFYLQNSLASDVEKLIWGGSGNTVAGVQDGFVDKALASSDALKVNGVTIDATNVLTEIAKVYDMIPNSVLFEGEFDPSRAAVKIFVDINTMRYLKQALSTTPTNYQVTLPSWAIEGGKVFYMGVEIVAVGLPANTMIAASKDNMVVLTDLLADTAKIKVQHGNDLKDESMVYYKGAYRLGVDFIFEDEVVVYSK